MMSWSQFALYIVVFARHQYRITLLFLWKILSNLKLKIMALSFTVSDVIPASKGAIYNAWLDSKQHAAMTNTSDAEASTRVGGSFMAHDGYITGTNLELIPDSKIVQSWRSTEFSEDEADSLIEVTLEDAANGTLVTLTHSNLPPHGAQYESGWKAFYFEPMKAYFGG
jgi:uncharacterized protein YndB with AHSA1/START domain